MKKLGLLFAAGLVVVGIQSANAFPVDFTPSMLNEGGIQANHDMRLLNQRRFEFEQAREYQAEQKVKEQEAELKAKFQQYKQQTDTPTMPKTNMEFLQNKDGSIIIKEAQ